LQAKLQTLLLHVALLLGGGAHTVVQSPQRSGSLVVSTHDIPHSVGTAASQPLEHAPPLHTGVPPVHTRVHEPHVAGAVRFASQPLPAAPSQSAKPAAQAKPQAVPLHVEKAFAGASQGVQLFPQEASESFDRHAPPQRWNPASQLKPQLVPSQLGAAFGGGAHAVHDAPQVADAESETQASPQRWNPALQVKPQLVPSHVLVAFARTGHAPHEAPQLPVLMFGRQALPHA